MSGETHTFCMHWSEPYEWDAPCSVHRLRAERQQAIAALRTLLAWSLGVPLGASPDLVGDARYVEKICRAGLGEGDPSLNDPTPSGHADERRPGTPA